MGIQSYVGSGAMAPTLKPPTRLTAADRAALRARSWRGGFGPGSAAEVDRGASLEALRAGQLAVVVAADIAGDARAAAAASASAAADCAGGGQSRYRQRPAALAAPAASESATARPASSNAVEYRVMGNSEDQAMPAVDAVRGRRPRRQGGGRAANGRVGQCPRAER